MAISTYAELKSAVADFMNRSDMTTAQVENFVSLCEADIRNDVRVRAMETSTAVTITNLTMPAPTLMLEARELTIDDYQYKFVPLDIFTAHRKAGSASKVFTQKGSNFLVNAGGTAVVNLTYLEAPAALTTSTATNYILTQAPDVYLYGSCAHAAQYYQDPANLERFKTLYLGGVKRLNDREARAKFSGSPLAIYPANME